MPSLNNKVDTIVLTGLVRDHVVWTLWGPGEENQYWRSRGRTWVRVRLGRSLSLKPNWTTEWVKKTILRQKRKRKRARQMHTLVIISPSFFFLSVHIIVFFPTKKNNWEATFSAFSLKNPPTAPLPVCCFHDSTRRFVAGSMEHGPLSVTSPCPLSHQPSYLGWHHIKMSDGASLVAQWLRICLLMQGTRVRALVWENPTCRGATGPVSHNYWACASGACAPQRDRPR